MYKTIAALTLALLSSAQLALAHAHLQSSDPAANTTLASSPTTLRLTFSEPIEPKFSTARLLDANGKVIPTDASEGDSQDPKLLVLQLPTALVPGAYKVEWRVVAEDSHPMSGSFSFRVKQ